MQNRDLSSYMMSLDQLDLNYINKNNLEPDYQNPYIPLWKANKKTECYKLEIFSDYEVFTPKYKCHVCDVQVPVMYSEDHELSERHRICLDIMDIALERTRGHVKHKNDNTAVSYKSHTYFCNVCTKAVSVERKDKHDLSKKHLYCIKQEQLLNKLLAAYSNKDIDSTLSDLRVVSDDIGSKEERSGIVNGQDISLKDLTNDLDHNIIGNNADIGPNVLRNDFNQNVIAYSANITPKDLDRRENENGVNIGPKVHKIVLEETELLKDNTTMELNKKEIVTLKCDKSIMVKINDTENKLEVTACNIEDKMKQNKDLNLAISTIKVPSYLHYKGENHLIPIKTNDGCILKVNFDNFNGIITKNTNNYCILCSECIADISQHVLLDNHLRKIAGAVENVHCLRHVNEFLSHCIICNDLTIHTDVHITNVEHYSKLNEILENLDNMLESDEDTFNIEIIEVDKPIENHATSDNMEASDNAVNVKFANTDNTEASNGHTSNIEIIDVEKPVDNHITSDDMGASDNAVNVKFANTDSTEEANDLANEVLKLKDHVAKHKLHYQIMVTETAELMCKVCDELFKDIDSHVTSKNHMRMYEDIINENKLRILGEDRYFCEVCNSFILKSCELYHVNRKKHRSQIYKAQNTSSKSLPPKSVSDPDLDMESVNDVSQFINSATESATSVSESVESEPGAMNFVSISATTLTESINPSGPIQTKDRSTNYVELINFRSIMDSMTDSVTSVMKSIIGESGAVNSASGSMISASGSMVSINSDSVVCPPHFCEICQVKVPNHTANINEHNKGANHQKKLQALKIAVNKPSNVEKPIPLKIPVNKPSNVEKPITKNQFCQLCNTNVSSKVDMATHVKSDTHIQLYDLVMKTNRIWKRIDNMLFCYYCKVEISPLNEIDHINGAKHLKNRKDPTKLGLELFGK